MLMGFSTSQHSKRCKKLRKRGPLHQEQPEEGAFVLCLQCAEPLSCSQVLAPSPKTLTSGGKRDHRNDTGEESWKRHTVWHRIKLWLCTGAWFAHVFFCSLSFLLRGRCPAATGVLLWQGAVASKRLPPLRTTKTWAYSGLSSTHRRTPCLHGRARRHGWGSVKPRTMANKRVGRCSHR